MVKQKRTIIFKTKGTLELSDLIDQKIPQLSRFWYQSEHGSS